MRAYRIGSFGSVEGVVLGSRGDPRPGTGEILLRVRATSLNYRDLMVLKGGGRGPTKPMGSHCIVGVVAFANSKPTNSVQNDNFILSCGRVTPPTCSRTSSIWRWGDPSAESRLAPSRRGSRRN